MSNPYNYSTVVTDPKAFFGREDVLSGLYTRLKGKQSTSVVGLRRVGKSSLLYQLARTLPDVLGQNCVPLYIDLQDARYRTMVGFLKSIMVALNGKMGKMDESLTLSSVADMSGFSTEIERLSHAGICPVLCLDEFEEFMKQPEEFDDNFLEALRSLGGRGRLAMVTASRIPLPNLIQAGRLTSPFYNIFSQIELGLLERDAAQRLRREPFEREGIILSSGHEALVEELGGRHPFFLQMVCFHLYDALHRPQRAQADVVDIVWERFDLDAKPHFERLWDHLSADERVALKVVIDQSVPTSEIGQTLRRLARLGVVEQADGNWRPFSAAFAGCLQEYSSVREVPEVSQDKGIGEEEEKVPIAGVLVVACLIVLTLILLTIGALTDSVIFILLSAISAGLLLFLAFWYRRTDVERR